MKLLVTAASRHGATTEVAASIGAMLAAAGHQVQVLHPLEVDNLHSFDAVVIGSAVYMGRWMEPARELVEREKVVLTHVPVWLFSCGPVGDPPTPADESLDGVALAELVRAREHVTFAGRIERRRLGFGEKAIMAAVRAPEGDFRDWQAIETWARGIAAALSRSGALV